MLLFCLLTVLLTAFSVTARELVVQAHFAAQDDKLVKVEPLLSMVGNWRDFLALPSEEEMNTLRKHERTGRPLGQEAFVDQIEAMLLRTLRPQKPGPKLKIG